MNARRCVARSERAKYKEGVELLARLALFEHPPGPVFIVFAGQRRIRKRERGRYFQPFFATSQGSEQTVSIRIPFTLRFPPPSFLISVNFDKYIDPKVSTALETFVSKGTFFSSDLEFDLETGLSSFYRPDINIYIYIVRRMWISINNPPRSSRALSAAIKRIDPRRPFSRAG